MSWRMRARHRACEVGDAGQPGRRCGYRRGADGVPVGAGPADRAADGPRRAAPRRGSRAAPLRCASAGRFAAAGMRGRRGRTCTWCAGRTTRTGRGRSHGGSGWCRWISLRCRRSTPTGSSGWLSRPPRPATSCSLICSARPLARRCAWTRSTTWSLRRLRRAGIDPVLRPHQLRHAFGSNVADAGGGIDVIAELLGPRLGGLLAGVCASGPGPAAGSSGEGAQPARRRGGDAGDRGRARSRSRRARAGWRAGRPRCPGAAARLARRAGPRSSLPGSAGIRSARVIAPPPGHLLLHDDAAPGAAPGGGRHRVRSAGVRAPGDRTAAGCCAASTGAGSALPGACRWSSSWRCRRLSRCPATGPCQVRPARGTAPAARRYCEAHQYQLRLARQEAGGDFNEERWRAVASPGPGARPG